MVGLTGLVLGISRGGLTGWGDPLVLGGLAPAIVLLPAFVLIEARSRAPMLDLDIFRNRMFAAATGAAFINGLSRFALMFVFVFYYQGAQGDDAITAGSSSRRWRSGCSSPRRWPACGPTATARARSPRSG